MQLFSSRQARGWR